MLTINNGKFSQGGMINPFAAVNDGLVDLTWVHEPAWNGVFGIADIFEESLTKAGTQVYKGHSKYLRGRKIKLTFKGKVGSKYDAEHGPQVLSIDGE